MPAFKDITGERFGKLYVVKRAITDKPRAWWKCKCDCGKEIIVSSDSLKKGTQSCGCLQKERLMETITKHGCGGRNGRKRIYRTWSGMIQRTTNPKDKYFSNYGGRGIGICDEWKSDFSSFYEWAMSHGYAEDLYIDRIDNDSGYYPDNCRFVTRFQQQNNLRCNIRYVFLNGEVQTLSEIAHALNMRSNKARKELNKYVEKTDEISEKSGLPHLYYLNCNAAFLCEMEKEK